MKRCIAILFLFIGLQSGPNASHDQKQEIQTLIQSFVKTANENGNLSVYLSPNRTQSEIARQNEVIRTPFAEMKITGYSPESDIKLQGTDRASLAAHIDWTTVDTETAGTVTVHFENVAGRWYFRDFDFVYFPQRLVFWILAVCLAYTLPLGVFLIHLNRTTHGLPRQRWKWSAVLAIPFVGFIIYLAQKSWKKYPQRTAPTTS